MLELGQIFVFIILVLPLNEPCETSHTSCLTQKLHSRLFFSSTVKEIQESEVSRAEPVLQIRPFKFTSSSKFITCCSCQEGVLSLVMVGIQGFDKWNVLNNWRRCQLILAKWLSRSNDSNVFLVISEYMELWEVALTRVWLWIHREIYWSVLLHNIWCDRYISIRLWFRAYYLINRFLHFIECPIFMKTITISTCVCIYIYLYMTLKLTEM